MKTLLDPVQVCHHCEEIKGQLDLILSEIRALKRERLPASPEKIEGFLSAIYVFYPDRPFTSAWLLEYAVDPDPDSVTLCETITGVIGRKATVNRLSRFLRRSVGTYGNLKLEIVNLHSRDGCLFLVTNVSDSVTTSHLR